jgi:hypothetical protein
MTSKRQWPPTGLSLVRLCKRGVIGMAQFNNMFVNQVDLDNLEQEVDSLPSEFRESLKAYVESMPIDDPEWPGSPMLIGYIPNESQEAWDKRFAGVQEKNRRTEKALHAYFKRAR